MKEMSIIVRKLHNCDAHQLGEKFDYASLAKKYGEWIDSNEWVDRGFGDFAKLSVWRCNNKQVDGIAHQMVDRTIWINLGFLRKMDELNKKIVNASHDVYYILSEEVGLKDGTMAGLMASMYEGLSDRMRKKRRHTFETFIRYDMWSLIVAPLTNYRVRNRHLEFMLKGLQILKEKGYSYEGLE